MVIRRLFKITRLVDKIDNVTESIDYVPGTSSQARQFGVLLFQTDVGTVCFVEGSIVLFVSIMSTAPSRHFYFAGTICLYISGVCLYTAAVTSKFTPSWAIAVGGTGHSLRKRGQMVIDRANNSNPQRFSKGFVIFLDKVISRG